MDTDIELFENSDESLGKEIAKSFLISAAASVGSLVGLVVIAAAWNKIETIKKKRADKKNIIVKEEVKEED